MMVLTDSCLAESMNEQVFTTIPSASSARDVICAPPVCSMPIMTSLSTRFLGQPRLTKPTFKGRGRGADFSCKGAIVEFSTGMLTIHCSIETDSVFAPPLGLWTLERVQSAHRGNHMPNHQKPKTSLLKPT